MTKSVLIAEVTKKVEGLTARQIEVIVDTVFDGMKGALAHGEKIEIRGFVPFASNSEIAGRLEIPKPEKRYKYRLEKPSTSK